MTEINELVTALTLEEKALLCSGSDFWHTQSIERLGIPSIMLTDGPHGLRKQTEDGGHVALDASVPATCFPTASALAATWNRELIYQVGAALGEECRQEHVAVILGPGANIKRTPLCGRNFEYFSEDPYLSGEMAKSHIRGVQSQGVGASIKHFAVNNQETRRMTIDAVVDARALHEIYLAGFEIAVKGAQPWTVMTAYNRVNDTYCSEHPQLLKECLRERWGYQGLIVTDWGAMNHKIAAMEVGLDLEMPGSNNNNDAILVEAVRSGKLDEAVLDNAVEHILAMVFKADETLAEEYTYDVDRHHALARAAAREGAVLLKNEGHLLPLRKENKVALLGAFARFPRYQGAGSSTIHPTRIDTLFSEMTRLSGDGAMTYAPGYSLKGDEVMEDLIQEAVNVAVEADVVVIHAGLPEQFEIEGVDRTHLRLPESHTQLITAVAAAHDRVIVVLSNGAPVEMPWLEDVEAVLEGYLGGQAGAGGVADLIYGLANPSGKLAETFPLRLEDTPAYHHYPGGPRTVEYRESIYVGYRFYDTVGKDVLFPFGHGLSYTTFDYSDLRIREASRASDGVVEVTVTINNTGRMTGKEIVQLYVSPERSTAFRPRVELKGFEKVLLQPGEAKDVSFTLDERSFAFFNSGCMDWQVEPGRYHILVGASSRDIRLRGVVEIEPRADSAPIPERDRLPAYRQFPADGKVSTSAFEALIGRPLPANKPEQKGDYTLNTPLVDMRASFFAARVANLINRQIRAMMKGDPDSPNAQMIQAVVADAPLRFMMLGDQLSRGVVEGLLLMMNGRIIKGVLHLMKHR